MSAQSVVSGASPDWEGRARPPNPVAATFAQEKQLPDELEEFYFPRFASEPVWRSARARVLTR